MTAALAGHIPSPSLAQGPLPTSHAWHSSEQAGADLR